jgi:hypothetical protein
MSLFPALIPEVILRKKVHEQGSVLNSFGTLRMEMYIVFNMFVVGKTHSDYEKDNGDYVVQFTQLKDRSISQTSRRQLGCTKNLYVINASCGAKHSLKCFISSAPPRVHIPHFSCDPIHRTLRG